MSSVQAPDVLGLLERLADWTLVLDSGGCVRQVTGDLPFGLARPAEFCGRPWTDLLPLPSHPAVANLLAQSADGGTHGPVELELAGPPGARIPLVAWAHAPAGDQGRRVLFFRDAAVRHPGTPHAGQWAQWVTLGVLSRGVAHRFNNVLAGVMLNAELLGHADGSQRQNLLRRIMTSAEGGADLCRVVLNLTSPAEPEPGPIDLGLLLNGLIALFETESRRHCITVDVTMEEDLSIVAVSPWIQQAIINLLLCAQEQAGSRGYIRVSVSRSEDAICIDMTSSASDSRADADQPDAFGQEMRDFYKEVGASLARRLGGSLDLPASDQLRLWLPVRPT